LEKVVLASFRRSLCYPLYRNWKLSELVFKDVIEMINKGIFLTQSLNLLQFFFKLKFYSKKGKK